MAREASSNNHGLILPTLAGNALSAAPGTWQVAGPLSIVRGYHTAATPANGQVLIAGGADTSAALNTAGSTTVWVVYLGHGNRHTVAVGATSNLVVLGQRTLSSQPHVLPRLAALWSVRITGPEPCYAPAVATIDVTDLGPGGTATAAARQPAAGREWGSWPGGICANAGDWAKTASGRSRAWPWRTGRQIKP